MMVFELLVPHDVIKAVIINENIDIRDTLALNTDD